MKPLFHSSSHPFDLRTHPPHLTGGIGSDLSEEERIKRHGKKVKYTEWDKKVGCVVPPPKGKLTPWVPLSTPHRLVDHEKFRES